MSQFAPDKWKPERLRHWHGQMLRARDFRNQSSIDAFLRFWHNRAVHNAFGTSIGLTVNPIEENDRLMAGRVGCGVAVDCHGRELLVRGCRDIPLPREAEDDQSFDLRIAWKKPDGREAECCMPAHVNQSNSKADDVEFFWVDAQYPIRTGVPIWRVHFKDKKFQVDDRFVRPRARQVASAQVASGIAEIDLAAVEFWRHGLRVWVDTRPAGFKSVPHYFAGMELTFEVGGEKMVYYPMQTHIHSITTAGFSIRSIIDGFNLSTSVINAKYDSVRENVSAVLAAIQTRIGDPTTGSTTRSALTVRWVGVEPKEQPSIDCGRCGAHGRPPVECWYETSKQ